MPAQEIARGALAPFYENRLRALEHSNLGQTTAVLRRRLHDVNLRISRLFNHYDQGDRLNAAYTVTLLNARHIAAILEYRCRRQQELAKKRTKLNFRNPRRG